MQIQPVNVSQLSRLIIAKLSALIFLQVSTKNIAIILYFSFTNCFFKRRGKILRICTIWIWPEKRRSVTKIHVKCNNENKDDSNLIIIAIWSHFTSIPFQEEVEWMERLAFYPDLGMSTIRPMKTPHLENYHYHHHHCLTWINSSLSLPG